MQLMGNAIQTLHLLQKITVLAFFFYYKMATLLILDCQPAKY